MSQIDKFRELLGGENRLNINEPSSFCRDFEIILETPSIKKKLPKSSENRKELYEPFLKALGVPKKELQDKNYNINYICSVIEKKDNKKKISESETVSERKTSIIETANEITERKIENETKSSVYYTTESKRLFTIVDVPAYAFYKNIWLTCGSPVLTPRTCKRCSFYLSTGTSNDVNFPNIWFPFLRIQEQKSKLSKVDRGWINKTTNLVIPSQENEKPFTRQFSRKFREFFKQQYNEDLDQYINTFKYFFEKFSHWWQVSVSAALDTNADSGWNNDPFLLKIKLLALQYDYLYFENEFVRRNDIVKRYLVKKPLRELSTPEEINEWLQSNDALCEKRDS
jgi:hypothetical protein